MNRTKLKNYAPQARRDFIQAMIDRAAFYGITATKTESIVVRGDVAVIAGREFPRSIATKREKLVQRIDRHGFAQTMEAMAYTWFNRLVAIRFMELHGYFDHGYRVLSHPDGKPTPEIVEHAEHVELPELKKEVVIDLKLAGNKEGELYRLLLLAQCNALTSAMPFLFEKLDKETELLLPDNLLNSDSLIRKLVGEIDEPDWQEVEIIGWLYQFYISEKKDQVIGKVVASEDIPAATQLFTPNWIVKYLVQNTLGRQWLATYPDSPLRQQMEYYIEPAEQTPEVQEQLKAITPTSLNPEELTLLDPACGSGHILVEAYDLFKAIYQERGYRAKDIPALILEKNLFGLEIDDRAAQLAAFALMMKARADDRRIFESKTKPNVVAIQESKGLDAAEIYYALTAPLPGESADELEPPPPAGHLFETEDDLFTRAAAVRTKPPFKASQSLVNFSQADIVELLELFANAKTLGSLIRIPKKITARLPEIEKRIDDVLRLGNLTHSSVHVVKPILRQAQLLASQYCAVVANPPYVGSKAMNSIIKTFVSKHFSTSKHDLFAAFVERCRSLAWPNTQLAFVTPYVWMFLSSYESFRDNLLATSNITSLIQLEYNGFEPACVPVCAYALSSTNISDYKGDFVRLSQFKGHENQPLRTLEAIGNPDCPWRFKATTQDFSLVPGTPIAYWLNESIRNVFRDHPPLATFGNAAQGLSTADNDRFIRYWFEISSQSFSELNQDKSKWFPFNKGGPFRKWYGNILHVINWADGGKELREMQPKSVIRNPAYYFRDGLTWSDITSSTLSARKLPSGCVFGDVGPSFFTNDPGDTIEVLAYLNSPIAAELAHVINPTMHFQVGAFGKLPFSPTKNAAIQSNVKESIKIAKDDWDSSELSWEFTNSPIRLGNKVETDVDSLSRKRASNRERMKALEENNAMKLLEFYALDCYSPKVHDDCITLRSDAREEDIKQFVSYSVGCMMGRYSLDKPGLIYAHSGNQSFWDVYHEKHERAEKDSQGQFSSASCKSWSTFPPDGDGIIPLLDTDWGIADDATHRIVQFISVAWPKEHLDENLKFIADSLDPSSGEQPRDTIRRYFASAFYKHHLSMYKRRPIYWLFSSGKQRAFQCLVYLHRYNEGTLARMRTEYVIPLLGQIAARIEQLEGDKIKAASTSHGKKLQKEQDKLKKQQVELLAFEEKLHHYADQRITLDLDDGVKVNYAKFGDLLAETKAVTGGKQTVDLVYPHNGLYWGRQRVGGALEFGDDVATEAP